MPTPSPRTDTYCFLGRCVSVRCSSQPILDRLRLMYRRFLVNGTGAAPEFTVDIADDLSGSGTLEIRDPWWSYRMSRTEQQCHYSCQSVATGEFDGFGFCEPMVLVQNALLQTVAMMASDRLLVHAGAVELGGRAAVLAAQPRMGKTTMALRLATMGCRLLSDEVACLSRHGRRVDPFPRAVNVRERALGMLGLPRDGTYVPTGAGAEGEEFAIDAEQLPGVRFSEGCEAGYLIFLRGFGDAPCLEPLSKGRALFHLADFCIGPAPEPSSFLFELAPLVEETACYTLVIGGLDETARLLMEMALQAADGRGEARP